MSVIRTAKRKSASVLDTVLRTEGIQINEMPSPHPQEGKSSKERQEEAKMSS